MRRVIFSVFAHPDDEAFGPSGTIARLAGEYDVHLITVTDGASDPKFHPVGGKTLAAMRHDELEASAKALGVAAVHRLNFRDGTLCNNIYHDVAARIQDLVNRFHPTLLITNEMRGVSGHLDHIAVSMITSFVYRQNQAIDAIWYNCVSRQVSDSMGEYFVFFPPGFDKRQVDMVVDVSETFDKKVAAAKCHGSQQHDVDRVVTRWMNLPKEELFFVTARRTSVTIR